MGPPTGCSSRRSTARLDLDPCHDLVDPGFGNNAFLWSKDRCNDMAGHCILGHRASSFPFFFIFPGRPSQGSVCAFAQVPGPINAGVGVALTTL